MYIIQSNLIGQETLIFDKNFLDKTFDKSLIDQETFD